MSFGGNFFHWSPPLPAARAARTYSEVGVWRRECGYPVTVRDRFPFRSSGHRDDVFPRSRGPGEGIQLVATADEAG